MKMKTMFKLPQLCGAVLLLSCTTSELPPDKNIVTPTLPTTGVVIEQPTTPTTNTSDIIPDLFPFMDVHKQYFIKEKISYNSVMNTNALFSAKMASPDMGEIVKSGEKVNMIAVGGSMTAGFRNGGLYRAGQMTAYPNLVARQMGISDFQSPLFGENEANGTGYVQLVDDGSKYPSWKEVTNNKAILKAGGPPELPKYVGGAIHNYGIPEGGTSTFRNRLSNGPGVYYSGRSWNNASVFASRMYPQGIDAYRESLKEQMVKQPVNFFMVENGSFDAMATMLKDNSFPSFANYGYDMVVLDTGNYPQLWKQYMEADRGATKGVVFTFPTITDLPYLNWYSAKELKETATSISITTERNTQTYTMNESSQFALLPTPTVDALFRNLKKGDKVAITLDNRDILDTQELASNVINIKQYNERVRRSAKDNDLAIVDLEKIYSQVNANSYISNDGFKVTGGGRGNFFSSDGLYPSAIGQAVIANEVIKAINTTYKSNIPLINLSDFSKSVGKE
jgi:hypothetical protein